MAEDDRVSLRQPGVQDGVVEVRDGAGDRVAQFDEAIGDAQVGQRAFVEVMFLNAVGKQHSKLGAGLEALVKGGDFRAAGQLAGEGVVKDILAEPAQRAFRVPNVEPPAGARDLFPRGPPVVPDRKSTRLNSSHGYI